MLNSQFLISLKRIRYPVLVALIAFGLFIFFVIQKAGQNSLSSKRNLRLVWLVPDGFRADSNIFRLFDWADEGTLPNIKKLLSMGSATFSIPAFPSHTPANMATLFTGALPREHGVNDGAMRLPGYPLSYGSRNGFSSSAKQVVPIWSLLEQLGMHVALFSVPGSTPPELSRGLTIKGRWGGWGPDFNSIVFQDLRAKQQEMMEESRSFYSGPKLTEWMRPQVAMGWKKNLISEKAQNEYEYEISIWGQKYWILVQETKVGFEKIIVSNDKQTILAALSPGEWSNWLPAELSWEMKNDYNVYSPKANQIERSISELKISTQIRLQSIRINKKEGLRLRVIVDGLNEYLVQPDLMYQELKTEVGAFVDYPDSYPPQLVYFPEDKKTFLDELEFSFRSHKKGLEFILGKENYEVVIQTIYSPNQMLTGHWWMPYLDPKSRSYKKISERERKILWKEVKNMYSEVDRWVGVALNAADDNTVIVLSSDHGAIPLNYEVRLNELFRQKGWLAKKWNSDLQIWDIDWKKSKVAFVPMGNVYINAKGLAGEYRADRSSETLDLINKVEKDLISFKDAMGKPVLSAVHRRENLIALGLSMDESGDLVLATAPGFSISDTVSEKGSIVIESKKGGYKQAIIAEKEPGLWTPFIIKGPGIRGGKRLAQPIHHQDQMPTILRAMGIDYNHKYSGKVIEEIFK